ncbi:MAG: hypothetical protein JW955_25035 [Sedimentisphaerales bacterium]|nr:hypothetical protein [Sedimentisphaerales bacterium]
MSDARLQWVQYNHGEPGARPEPPLENERTRRRKQWEAARRGTATQAGQVAKGVLEGRSRLSCVERRLLAVLDEEGGAELVDRVVGLGLKRGVLRIETGDGVTVYELRLRWEQRLLRAVQKELPEVGVHAVRFALAKRHDQTSLER